jgi:hypothetical protein
VQHSTDQEPRIRQNPWFTDRLGSGNPDCRVSRLDVLHDREGLSWEEEQIKKHVMMVGSWSCMVSSEVHINWRSVSKPVREDKGKATVTESENEKDLKRALMVLSKGHEVVLSGYSRLLGDAARVMDRGEELGNTNLVDRVCREYNMDRRTDQVTQNNQGN